MQMQSFDSVIVWVILALGLFVYHQLMYFIVRSRNGLLTTQDKKWPSTLSCLIGALPLLGLLGTIMGLLDSFYAMSLGDSFNATSTLSQGIASALWTTQLGLVIAVPAWLLLSYFNRLIVKESLANAQ
ncbi:MULTISPECIES: MotA/TolQ/ExbB proton channel family protein [Pseudoalteromonas]|uniref:MotA/TolQ/ExbB proton channel family protein n=1 Tax=Pseudoalteromonas TaxID=53246 RepID=UPI0007DB185B|nr:MULTISPECIES: MotA/TolQ/ExbB proton channel family protein [Pseudoalteromonas]NMR25392.1 MotA/TolQ/ExbB proton channel family protein [Pseudoalteromonas sp. NEC-BIFX-2020_015]